MPISVNKLEDSRIIIMKFHDIVKPDDDKAAFKELGTLLATLSQPVGLIIDQSNYTPYAATLMSEFEQPVSITLISTVEEFDGRKIKFTVMIPPQIIAQSMKQQFEMFKQMNPKDFENTDIADNLADAKNIIERSLEDRS